MVSPDRRTGGPVRLRTATGAVRLRACTLRIGLVARWGGDTEAARGTEGERAPMSHEPGQHGLGGPYPVPRPPSGDDPAAEPTSPPPAAAPWVSPGAPPTDAPGQPGAGPLPTQVGWQPAMPGRPVEQPGAPEGPVALRPLGVGEILGTAAGIFRRNASTVLPTALLLVTLQQVLLVAMLLLSRDVPSRTDLASGVDQLNLIGGLGAILGLLVSSVVGAVLTGMVVVLVAEDLLGQRLGIGEVWNRVQARLLALVGVSLLTTVLSILGLALLLVPGAILWAGWALSVPALLLERLGPIQAMRRSWQLAWPDVLRVFGIRLLAFLLGLVILYVIATPFSALGALASSGGGAAADEQASPLLLFLAAVGSILGGIIMRPFVAAVLALLYLDRRMRAEGMDLVLHLQLRHRRQPLFGPGQQQRSDLPALSDPGPGWAGGPVPASGGYPPAVGTP